MVRKLVLLVDDNADDRALTVRAFERHNFGNAIEVAGDAMQALDYLFSPGSDGKMRSLPDLVLLDLSLPKVDGLELLRRIRASERTRFVPVVVLTSSGEQRDLVQSYALGANSYVRKPVSFTEFMEASRQLGTYWLVMNLTPRQGFEA